MTPEPFPMVAAGQLRYGDVVVSHNDTFGGVVRRVVPGFTGEVLVTWQRSGRTEVFAANRCLTIAPRRTEF